MHYNDPKERLQEIGISLINTGFGSACNISFFDCASKLFYANFYGYKEVELSKNFVSKIYKYENPDESVIATFDSLHKGLYFSATPTVSKDKI